MAKNQKSPGGLDASVQTLVKALAEKGTPGLILLGIICLSGWIATLLYLAEMFAYIPKAKPPSGDAAWVAYTDLGLMLAGALTFALLSFGITRAVLSAIVPTIREEGRARSLTTAFGGRVALADGSVALRQIGCDQARRRIKRVLEALVEHAAQTLQANGKEVRANVCASQDGLWLRIADDLHINLHLVDELHIEILNGSFSTGTAFRYSRAILSIRHPGQKGSEWPYNPGVNTAQAKTYHPELIRRSKEQIKLAHPDLHWIISMPIPYQVSPFSLACGVLSLDGFQQTLHRDQLKQLLNDAATAAALIGVINRSTDILGSVCQRPDAGKPAPEEKDALEQEFMIPATEFDPAECPEPSPEFKLTLSKIAGLEFLGSLSTSDLALFLREQLRY